jgi:hypothetical protein
VRCQPLARVARPTKTLLEMLPRTADVAQNPLRLGEVGQGPRQRPEVGDLGLGVGALLDEQPRELFATQREPVEVVRRHRCEVGRGVDDVLTCDEVGHADWEDVVAVPEIGHHGAWELSCNG